MGLWLATRGTGSVKILTTPGICEGGWGFGCGSLGVWGLLVETPDEIEKSALIEARGRLEEFFDETVDDAPDDVEFLAVLGNPIDELLAESDKFDDPILVAGTRGASRLQELFLGNTARRLVRRSEVPVILVPPQAEVEMPERLVVGIDFSAPSRAALRRAAKMARTYGATVHAVYGYVLPEIATFDGAVANAPQDFEEVIEEKRRRLEEIVREEGVDDVVTEVSAVQRPPAAALMEAATDDGAQFLFVGSHGRRGFKRFFLGNTAERVMRKSPCAIFIDQATEEDREAAKK